MLRIRIKEIKKIDYFIPKNSPYPYPHPDDWMYIDTEEKLYEMSFSRKDVERRLSQYDNVIQLHLLKLFYFRDNQRDFNGWTASVYKCAFSVPKIKNPKGKDKLPSAQFIFDNLWGNIADCFESSTHDWFIKSANYKGDPEYKDLPYIHAQGDMQMAENFIRAYHVWLAEKLSKDGEVKLKDVQNKIKELLRKYPYKSK